eukprot:TRINITY_DN21177_c0_g1_i1.p1 TRINITY_DN21177_c0_g1~~TRINITY_DN21177_c0_g1_i1.p1  ORF type:complete len:264 (-),score=-15.75 TRINITY_DN21177_c0_g1_i1:147-938(-)
MNQMDGLFIVIIIPFIAGAWIYLWICLILICGLWDGDESSHQHVSYLSSATPTVYVKWSVGNLYQGPNGWYDGGEWRVEPGTHTERSIIEEGSVNIPVVARTLSESPGLSAPFWPTSVGIELKHKFVQGTDEGRLRELCECIKTQKNGGEPNYFQAELHLAYRNASSWPFVTGSPHESRIVVNLPTVYRKPRIRIRPHSSISHFILFSLTAVLGILPIYLVVTTKIRPPVEGYLIKIEKEIEIHEVAFEMLMAGVLGGRNGQA